jgi:hypothetical protein
MQVFTIFLVIFFLSLSLVYNKLRFRMRFWNITISLPIATSLNFIVVISNLFINKVAII